MLIQCSNVKSEISAKQISTYFDLLLYILQESKSKLNLML